MQQRAQDEIDAEDGFIRGYHGIPDDHVLRAMSDIEMYDALAYEKPGTTAHMVIEAEKRRREVLQVAEPPIAEPDHATNKPTNPAHHPAHWTNKFLWPTAAGVFSAVVAAMAIYVLKTHFGLPL